MEQDKETARLLRKARGFAKLIGHESWGDAKDELIAVLLQLNTISDLDVEKSAESLRFQVAVRKEITRIMYNWIGTIETKGKHQVNVDNARAEKEKWDHVVRS